MSSLPVHSPCKAAPMTTQEEASAKELPWVSRVIPRNRCVRRRPMLHAVCDDGSLATGRMVRRASVSRKLWDVSPGTTRRHMAHGGGFHPLRPFGGQGTLYRGDAPDETTAPDGDEQIVEAEEPRRTSSPAVPVFDDVVVVRGG